MVLYHLIMIGNMPYSLVYNCTEKNPKGNLFKMIKSIKNKYFFNIAGGKAKKSMVLVDDVARIILKATKTQGVFNLTDRYHPSFFEFSRLISSQLKRNQPLSLGISSSFKTH